MALHISYKPGEDQSVQAALYFREAAGVIVGSVMEGMTEQDHMIPGPEGVFLHLRIWSREKLDEASLHALFDHLLAVRSGLQEVQEHPGDPATLVEAASEWLEPHLEGRDLFVELAIAGPDGNGPETAEFSMGLVAGSAILISTDDALFTQLQDGLFGLALAGQGSYLVEVMAEPRVLRRAS
ncbi:MAG: hypothetical protein KDC03_16460 [Flavobacteriales bacterium]|nr:hypothetical protein [Flavobacteriales bacterium]